MYNGEHEIKFPEDKYLKNYLWYDYFHDSQVKNIDFTKNTVIIDIEYDKDNEMVNKKTYTLYFKNCEYFKVELLSMDFNTFINGRFKDTTLLDKVKNNNKGTFYHYRIETNNGFIDIIFSKFQIKKRNGRIICKDITFYDYTLQWLKSYKNGLLFDSDNQLSQSKLINLFHKGDDIEKYFVLDYLSRYTNEPILNYARDILCLEWDDFELSIILSISVIGRFGNKDDIMLLLDIYNIINKEFIINKMNYYQSFLLRRKILDSIDNIMCNENLK